MLFEDKTYEKLLQTCIDKAPKGIDTKQGSIFYDSCAAKCVLLAEIYADLDLVIEGCHIDSAVGQDLDDCAKDHSVTRNPPISLKCRAVFVGTTPAPGSRFFCNDVFFTLKDNLAELYPNDDELLAGGNLYIEAEITGTEGNVVKEGDALVPYTDVEGLISATVGEIIVLGADEEDDDSLRERLQNKIGGPSENGNKHHYKTWCEECEGVGYAKIFPLVRITDNVIRTGVPNWVTGVLLTDAGRAVGNATVELVQEYIDPDQLGLGEGVANMGAHFAAEKAVELDFDVSVSVELANSSYALEDVKNDLSERLTDYLKSLALEEVVFVNGVPRDTTIRVKQIGSLFSQSEKIIDYDNLQIRIGDEEFANANIDISPHCIAILHDISVTEMNA